MKLFIKNEDVRNKPGFKIYDCDGNDIHSVSIDYTVLGIKIDVFNFHLKRISKIRERGFYFNRTYKILTGDQKIKLLLQVKGSSILATIIGCPFSIQGDLSKKEFSILDENKTVLMEHKCKKNVSTYYELDIKSEDYELLCVCIALCIDTLLTINIKDAGKDVIYLVKDIFKDKRVLDGLRETFSPNKLDGCKNNSECEIIKED